MGFPLLSLLELKIFTLVLAVSKSCHAQDSPQDFLKPHNLARAEVGVGPLSWNHTVAAYAQGYANNRSVDCSLVHSHGPYGENLAWSSGDLTGEEAVGLWVEEKANYSYRSNSCVGGECKHYTQVVWHDSAWLGCAKVKCDNNGGTFVTCNYDPPGNVIGQLPYSGPSLSSNSPKIGCSTTKLLLLFSFLLLVKNLSKVSF